MNIQFMTKANEVKTKDIFGEEKTEYLPDYDELIKNASCDEEKELLERCKSKNCSFAFEIVYTAIGNSLDFDLKTREQHWVKKWQLYQHPWYREYKGKYETKENMIEIIRKENR